MSGWTVTALAVQRPTDPLAADPVVTIVSEFIAGSPHLAFEPMRPSGPAAGSHPMSWMVLVIPLGQALELTAHLSAAAAQGGLTCAHRIEVTRLDFAQMIARVPEAKKFHLDAHLETAFDDPDATPGTIASKLVAIASKDLMGSL